jgi:GDP-4-dehydro-6-deoxy-D-mannose reductase
MNALIIGAGGFVGGYLINDLLTNGFSVFATKLPFEKIEGTGFTVLDLDISDSDKIRDVILLSRPDVIFHLAALSSVALSWNNIKTTFNVNVIGAINLLNCVKEINKEIRILLIGSSEEYGFNAETKMPVSEVSPVNPSNPYAISKLSQTYLGKMYAEAFNMNIIMMRAFNHIGPKQPQGFVVPDFCKQIVEIERGNCSPILKTGNLNVKRDFTDVRDITAGYILCAKLGKSGKTYNIGSGKATAISDILRSLVALSSTEISIETDYEKMRPIDVPIVEADISQINLDTGWKPQIGLQQSLKDTLDFWRNK